MASAPVTPSLRGGGFGSRSAPNLRGGSSMARTQAIPHRGQHDCGPVMGHTHSNPVYVPRAQWTETEDSPMKTRVMDFNAKTFGTQEINNVSRQDRMKQQIAYELGQQMNERNQFGQSMKDEKTATMKSMQADTQNLLLEQQRKKDQKEATHQQMRDGLAQQAADIAVKKEQHRIREARDAAEMKLRSVKQLCEEFAHHDAKKRQLNKEYVDAVATKEAKTLAERQQKDQENETHRNSLKAQMLRDEAQLMAQQQRLKIAQACQDSNTRSYEKTAGKANKLKETNEVRRQDHDEQRLMALTDLHYSRREAARERQRQKMVQVLGHQMDTTWQKGEMERIQRTCERDAIDDACKKSMENDLKKLNDKKAQEREIQKTLVGMMMEKQAREQKEGFKVPLATSTMKSIVGSASEDNLHQRVDASRYLDKPMGKSSEVKPWVQINRSHGFGPMGVFGGEGRTRPALCSTGGVDRLQRTSQLATRDAQLDATWTDGVDNAALQRGRKAAARRQAARASDKANA